LPGRSGVYKRVSDPAASSPHRKAKTPLFGDVETPGSRRTFLPLVPDQHDRCPVSTARPSVRKKIMERKNGPSGGERTDGGPRPNALRALAQSKRARISESAGRPNTQLGRLPLPPSLRRKAETPAEIRESRGTFRRVWFAQSWAWLSVIRSNGTYDRSPDSKRAAAARGQSLRISAPPLQEHRADDTLGTIRSGGRQ
jgi:hypothetical protein